MTFNIMLAKEIFRIHTLYHDTRNLCQQYLVPESEKVSADITTTAEEIQQELENFRQEQDKKLSTQNMVLPAQNIIPPAQDSSLNHQDQTLPGKNRPSQETVKEPPSHYSLPDGILEETVVYRKIADYLSYHDGCVFHGVLIHKGGNGYLFTAASGTGKTTHARNWLKVFPDAFIINGDKPILRLEDNRIRGYGTPWAGKEGINRNTDVMLKAIIILDRGTENTIEKITPHAALSKLTGSIHCPGDSQGMVRAMVMLMKISHCVPIYQLSCNMDPDSARIAYKGLPK